ncbi:hypothetical protein JKF63_04399 [Porcisia hertigi]|uniref:Uncharacterized protein n=1 Tax=Porcisia hertigi TaxID=2761500 RepID=A0A836LC92_9TRYP|nr:hypothetical protein JKF63_04399 [Porcisia hertigi]
MSDIQQQHHSVDRESNMSAARDNAEANLDDVERPRSTNSSEDAGRRDSLGYPTPKTPDLSAGRAPINGSVPVHEETSKPAEEIEKRDANIGSPKSHPSSRGTSQQSAVARNGFGTAAAGATCEATPQTPEDYEAAIEAMRRECQRVSLSADSLEERLQLYSEVVSLRKELAVVQEDEQRLRQQLRASKAVVASSDLTVGKDVAIFEDEAQQSTLQKVWAEESEYNNPDTMEWASIDVGGLRERVDAAHKKYVAAIAKADKLYEKLEEAINETTELRDREKATIMENHEREMEGLGVARDQARQIASEKSYHRHRGTAKGSAVLLTQDKKHTMRQHRVAEVEFRTTEQVEKMKKELVELMEQVKLLKRHLDDSRQVTEAKRREYEETLKVVESEGADAREIKELFTKEEEELKELKADLQGVLHYLRAKNREEECW